MVNTNQLLYNHNEYFKRLLYKGSIKYSINIYGGLIDNTDENLIQISRYLWFYSNFKDEENLIISNEIFNHLISEYMIEKGSLVCSKKEMDYHLYSLSFALYGISEYYKVNNTKQVKQIIDELVNFIEMNFYDLSAKMYNEQLTLDLKISEQNKIGLGNNPYTANSVIHLMEAYSNLCMIDNSYKKLLKKVINILFENFYNENGYFNQFLDEGKLEVDAPISYGHDIETVWLVQEALDVLGISNVEYLDKLSLICQNVANQVLETGHFPVTSEGGESVWWAISEAIVGFKYANEKGIFKNELSTLILNYFLNNVYKTNHTINTFDDGGANPRGSVANKWKTPYHDGRMLLMVKRSNEND